MKVNKVDNPTSGDPVTWKPENMTIKNNFTSWHAVPSEYTQVAEYNSTTEPATTDTTLGAKLETTYATYIATNQPADTYEGKVKYTMVHPYSEPAPFIPTAIDCETGKICYNTNAPEGAVEGTMGKQSASDNSTVTLLASNFSRTGYGFAGWSDKFDYDTNTNAHFYGPNETITVPEGTTTNGLSLYAVWVKSVGNLQDSSKVASVCNALTTAPTDGTANLASVSALTDQRDNNTYAIAKLADGKCWMIENLRLEAENTRTTEKQALAQGYGASATYGNFSGLADAESANFSYSTIANSLYYSGTQDGTATININTTDSPGRRIPRYNNWNNQFFSANRPQNPTTNDYRNSTTNAGMYGYGNYYNWAAAIADTTHQSAINIGLDTSICPKGWRLPMGGQNTETAGQNGDFYVLTTTITGVNPNIANGGYAYYSGTVDGIDVGKLASSSLRSYPNNYLYSGFFYGGSSSNRGANGRYWTSTAAIYSSACSLNLSSSEVSPGTSAGEKFTGESLRCIASN